MPVEPRFLMVFMALPGWGRGGNRAAGSGETTRQNLASSASQVGTGQARGERVVAPGAGWGGELPAARMQARCTRAQHRMNRRATRRPGRQPKQCESAAGRCLTSWTTQRGSQRSGWRPWRSGSLRGVGRRARGGVGACGSPGGTGARASRASGARCPAWCSPARSCNNSHVDTTLPPPANGFQQDHGVSPSSHSSRPTQLTHPVERQLRGGGRRHAHHDGHE